MNQPRMESRRAHFKIGLVGHQSSQEKRRLEHLQIQRKRRSNAFDSIRGIEDLANCFLNEEESAFNENESTVVVGRYEDAIEEEEIEITNETSSGTKNMDVKNSNKSSSPTKNKKYMKHRDQCMRAEFLELSEGLPSSFDQDWLLLGPVPKGKRCLALTLSNHQSRSTFNGDSMNNSNTVTLLSRKNANLIGNFLTILPINCILDCIYDHSNQTLWILDILKWKDQAMIDCEAHFRFWWRDAKLSELGIQLAPEQKRLICIPIPVLFNFSMTQVAKITKEMLISSEVTQEITVLSSSNSNDKVPTSVSHSITYQSEGLLFYIKSATYESGESLLAGWVPLDVSEDQSNDLGVPKLNWLCERERDSMEE